MFSTVKACCLADAGRTATPHVFPPEHVIRRIDDVIAAAIGGRRVARAKTGSPQLVIFGTNAAVGVVIARNCRARVNRDRARIGSREANGIGIHVGELVCRSERERENAGHSRGDVKGHANQSHSIGQRSRAACQIQGGQHALRIGRKVERRAGDQRIRRRLGCLELDRRRCGKREIDVECRSQILAGPLHRPARPHPGNRSWARCHFR